LTVKSMSVNFGDVNDSGFLVIRPGVYQANVIDWKMYVKEETGNSIYQLEFEFLGGDYKGEKIRYWHNIGKDARSRGYLFNFYKNLGLVRDGDRAEDGNLIVDAVYGEVDEDGKTAINKLIVNGVERPTIGCKANLTVVNKEYNGNMTHAVKRIDPISVTPDGDVSDVPF